MTMAQDKEREIQLQFLEEAEDYLQTIESGLLGLSAGEVERQAMDRILRAAHSIKGSAAMMGFSILSHLAHRLEDSFKVLKAGKCVTADSYLEQLLLQAVDTLRQVVRLNRQDAPLAPEWLDQVQLIFDQLHQSLGDPQPEDAALLLNEEVGVDMQRLLFESEVEGCLQRLEAVLANPEQPCLMTEFLVTAQELHGLAEMLELSAFSQLCQSIIGELEAQPPNPVVIAQQALRAWRRSQALILTGQSHLLPTSLTVATMEATLAVEPPLELVADWERLENVVDLEADCLESFIPASLEELDLPPTLTSLDLDLPAKLTQPESLTAVPLEEPEPPAIAPNPSLAQPPVAADSSRSDQTVRISSDQLERLSDLFGELTIERNGLHLQLARLRGLVGQLGQKVRRLEQSNLRLRAIYDRGATQTTGHSGIAPAPAHHYNPPTVLQEGVVTAAARVAEHHLSGFDVLELDQYGESHLLSQEVMETIVQIQEITGDLEISLEDTEFTAGELTRTSKQMQTSITQVRMRPFADLVRRLPRALREMSLEYGKEVALTVHGASTLIDRTMLDLLSDPLLHLVRNAFDHGLESPEQRRRAGKPEQGTIEISASSRGNQTVITVRDDGRGIDLAKIRDRARRMGLDPQQLADASEAELLNLIFEPGFSTADQVTDLSGRGVGMDVVRTNLQQARGDIRVDTQPGVGTTFILTVPLTLSVLRVLLVESHGMLIAFPTDEIEEMLLLRSQPVLQAAGKPVINWEGYMVPLLPLHQWLRFPYPPRPADSESVPIINQPAVLLVTQGQDLLGIQVERCWGEQEVTIRQVEGNMPLPAGFMGCTILGDGRVVPLANITALLEVVEQISTPPQARLLAEPLTVAAPSRDYQTELILVIDDSINVRRFLALTLEKAGYRVEQAKDGQEALEKIQSGLAPQAVICDIEMPRLDGYGFLAHINAIPQASQIPVVMLTSRSGDKHRQLALQLGAASYFSKPFQEQELLQTLRQLICPPALIR